MTQLSLRRTSLGLVMCVWKGGRSMLACCSLRPISSSLASTEGPPLFSLSFHSQPESPEPPALQVQVQRRDAEGDTEAVCRSHRRCSDGIRPQGSGPKSVQVPLIRCRQWGGGLCCLLNGRWWSAEHSVPRGALGGILAWKKGVSRPLLPTC